MPLVPNSYTPDTIMLATIAAGRELGVDDLAIVCAIACQKVESNHIMWANELDPHSLDYPYQKISRDKNSSGVYQQRAPWWDDPTTDDHGGSSDRMDVRRSTRLFLAALQKQRNPDYHANPGVAIANTQRCREDLRWKYGAEMDYAWQQFHRLKNVPVHMPVPTPKPEVFAAPRPAFTEIERFGWGGTSRSRPVENFFLHTEEGSWDSSAESLAAYCQGQNNVSYHYTIRNRIVCDVVDTDLYSWSVLNANVFSINLCFAGSSVKQTRQQWLDRYGPDIEIAAWLAVQDSRKYPKMSTLVIPPPYSYRGPGISDHRYVTQKLGIGTHSDVGPNFPWDVFERHVLRFNGNALSGDKMTKEEHDALFQLWGIFMNPTDSYSAYAPPGEGDRWPLKEMMKHTNAFAHASLEVEHNAIVLGLAKDIRIIHAALSYTEEPWKVERATAAWQRIPDEYKAAAGFEV